MQRFYLATQLLPYVIVSLDYKFSVCWLYITYTLFASRVRVAHPAGPTWTCILSIICLSVCLCIYHSLKRMRNYLITMATIIRNVGRVGSGSDIASWDGSGVVSLDPWQYAKRKDACIVETRGSSLHINFVPRKSPKKQGRAMKVTCHPSNTLDINIRVTIVSFS